MPPTESHCVLLETTVALLIAPWWQPPPPPYTPPPAPPLPQPAANDDRSAIWERLAECESGEWINRGASFVEGSARWNYSDGPFEGGLQFHPDTWDWLRPADYPESAWQATRDQQIAVAERVLDAQGWAAWPVCSRLLGYR